MINIKNPFQLLTDSQDSEFIPLISEEDEKRRKTKASLQCRFMEVLQTSQLLF